MDKNEELKVYLFEVTRDKKGEDGQPCGRESLVASYAFVGDPDPAVEYNRYWDHGRDGRLNLVAKDGRCIGAGIDDVLVCVGEYGFSSQTTTIIGLVKTLEEPGKWFELSAGDKADTRLRMTRLRGLPEIDIEATKRNSDLNVMQMWAIHIDGKPLFDEGGTLYGKGSLNATMVFRPNLLKDLGRCWEELIAHREPGVAVAVTVTEDPSADSTVRKMCISAKTREELRRALKAVGVLRPDEVEPDVVIGQGDAPTAFAAKVLLTDVIS